MQPHLFVQYCWLCAITTAELVVGWIDRLWGLQVKYLLSSLLQKNFIISVPDSECAGEFRLVSVAKALVRSPYDET